MEASFKDMKNLSIDRQLKAVFDQETLLEFYKTKVNELEKENLEITKKFKEKLKILDQQNKSESELCLVNEENLHLNKSLYELQTCLFQERENLLLLHAENNKLKIKVLEDRQKIFELVQNDHQKCLQTVEHFKCRYCPLLKVTKDDAVVEDDNNVNRSDVHGQYLDESGVESFSLIPKLRALEEQLISHKKLASDEICFFKKERSLCQAEMDALSKSSSSKIRSQHERIKELENMLVTNIEEVLQLKMKSREKESKWINEISKLQKELDVLGKQKQLHLSISNDCKIPSSSSNPKRFNKSLETSNNFYKKKCSSLEEKINQLTSEKLSSENSHAIQLKKLQELLNVSTKRCSELERRRKLEAEGFKSDIMLLKSKVKILEKQLFLIHSEDNNKNHIELMQSLGKNISRYKSVGYELKTVKDKLFKLESNLISKN